MSKRKAPITGITGQDGSYLAELLLEKDYEVHGLVRRVALEDPSRRLRWIGEIRTASRCTPGRSKTSPACIRIVRRVEPHECYRLAAQSFVSYSFDDEFSTLNTNINGTHYLLAAIHEAAPRGRFYFAGSREMFGRVEEMPRNERTASTRARPTASARWRGSSCFRGADQDGPYRSSQ